MTRAILDCYTDEPAGLGVPPFIGVWPRYAAGWYDQKPAYLTIDDLRLIRYVESVPKVTIDPPAGRTHIEVLNHTRAYEELKQILAITDELVIVVGVQTPGKYLSARPGTLHEVTKLLASWKAGDRRLEAGGREDIPTASGLQPPASFRRVLTGPVLTGGTQFRGGARAQVPEAGDFDQLRPLVYDTYEQLQPLALKGAHLIRQMPRLANRIVEIETGRGCPREKGCSFCTEPIKQSVLWRKPELVIEEVKTLMGLGARAFRLGKQSCIYSYEGGDPQRIEAMLAPLAALAPTVLHLDNANPMMINEQRTELFVKYLTP
ncbi:MAG: hypothetical protein MUC88_10005, partial [Planctomycetes bacterium]|nr:hypothetical protein [Planctomycetota bacterium]